MTRTDVLTIDSSTVATWGELEARCLVYLIPIERPGALRFVPYVPYVRLRHIMKTQRKMVPVVPAIATPTRVLDAYANERQDLTAVAARLWALKLLDGANLISLADLLGQKKEDNLPKDNLPKAPLGLRFRIPAFSKALPAGEEVRPLVPIARCSCSCLLDSVARFVAAPLAQGEPAKPLHVECAENLLCRLFRSSLCRGHVIDSSCVESTAAAELL